MAAVYDVAVVGATGVVGEMILQLLDERQFPVGKIYPLASERSEGKRISFGGKQKKVGNLATFDFSKVQFAFFSAGAERSAEYAPRAAEAGCIVIDNTSHFRYETDIPLVVPEVNAQALENYRYRNIIANPNCSTIQLVVALKPIYDAVGIVRVNVATYQSVSGAGRRAIGELAEQTAHLLNGQPITSSVFPLQIAFNAIPHIDVFQENGYTKEEMKMVWETQKIMGDPNLLVNPTAVRVPVFFAHSEAVHIETRDPISPEEVKERLSQAPGIIVIDKENTYPTAISHAVNADAVFVGRIRRDISHPNGLDLWIVADNIRKGAALNAVQIAEVLINEDFYS
ncbi:aspartate-semialdehyde dehydrogenase [Coxiella burnetii]|uniref:Aspartate-semialdehyde dehydrogenase n=1 Tax=Coxiella burnetii (strain RSA 493 / Nine Mile phase I) TaxID=227377 RepID=Q83D66_COXBU|nr:aspartate-semialdehyde dehydrogenase [Coxiella burnetii]NP_819893.1 aspartate-semialdehyde dehydrogenase [Coxiella burnetii RSA 493]AAO90407.1 aspartate-semialdehyde dehydrogenase [Coxiella burnetii RSA 493]ACJ18464.1 aspartate-semialdehyde dehydrogenase [Coxiella burnetii CbuG_Q212]ARI65707.1 aspartate-semialdehyde dehydrogenase [Coxiella burnetii]ARK27182.1 aspartate-semialdehyde dehydrogenase [Coxiella burnetii]ATN66845.1 aspartate-semialdehyde dehydrogenase [Coxiella burnetii]